MLVLTSILVSAALQAAVAAAPRKAYNDCLKTAVTEALKTKVPTDGFADFAHKHCAAYESSFKTGLVNFNVKNGMSKASAADDAQLQIDDYVFSAEQRYADKSEHGDN